MKVIALLLAIVATDVTQAHHVVLRSNHITNYNHTIGFLSFHESGTPGLITVNGTIKLDILAPYIFVVHEIKASSNSCDSLGPIVKSSPFGLLDIFTVVVDQPYGFFTANTDRVTLASHQWNSIVNRAIAVYDISTFDFHCRKPIHRSVACGFVNIWSKTPIDFSED